MMTHADWTEFYAWLMDTYWKALPPEERIDTQSVVPEGACKVPEDIWRSALLMYPDPYAWLSNPIPNLGGRTPFEVVAAGESDAIRAIIQDIASFMLPHPEEIQGLGSSS